MTLEIAHTFCDSSALGRRGDPTTAVTTSFIMQPTPLPAGSYPPHYSSHQPMFRPTYNEVRGPHPPMGYRYEPTTMQGYSTAPSYPPVVVYYHSPYPHSTPPPPPPPPTRQFPVYASPYRQQQPPQPQRRYSTCYTYASRRNDLYTSSSYEEEEEHYNIVHSSAEHPTAVSPLFSRDDDMRKRERFEEEHVDEPPALLRIMQSPIKKQRLFPPLNTPSVTARVAQCSPPTMICEKEEESSTRLEEETEEQDSTNRDTEQATRALAQPTVTAPIDKNTAEPISTIQDSNISKTTAASWSALDDVDTGIVLQQQPRLEDHDSVSVAAFRRRFQAHCEHHEAALALKALRQAT